MAGAAARAPTARNCARSVAGTAFASARGMRTFGLLVAASLARRLAARRLLQPLRRAARPRLVRLGGVPLRLLGRPTTRWPPAAPRRTSASRSPTATRSTRCARPTTASPVVSLGGTSGLNIVVQSAAPGQTQLQLVDAQGKLVDQVTVTVTATARLAITQGLERRGAARARGLDADLPRHHRRRQPATRSSAPAPSASTLADPLRPPPCARPSATARLLRPGRRRHHHRARAVGVAGAADHHRAADRADERDRHGAAEHAATPAASTPTSTSSPTARPARSTARPAAGPSTTPPSSSRAQSLGVARVAGEDVDQVPPAARRHLQRHLRHRRRFDHRRPAPLDNLSRTCAAQRARISRGTPRAIRRRPGGPP